MTIRLTIAVVFVVAGQVCMLIAVLQDMILDEDVHARLPPEKRIDPIWWGPLNFWKRDQLRKEIFPERWKRNWTISLLGMALFLVGGGIFLFGT